VTLIVMAESDFSFGGVLVYWTPTLKIAIAVVVAMVLFLRVIQVINFKVRV